MSSSTIEKEELRVRVDLTVQQWVSIRYAVGFCVGAMEGPLRNRVAMADKLIVLDAVDALEKQIDKTTCCAQCGDLLRPHGHVQLRNEVFCSQQCAEDGFANAGEFNESTAL